ncbi:hypothetical protein P4K96_32420, partial [Bacillus cereus]|nr:hypothetical protein [Bacillus cereus]
PTAGSNLQPRGAGSLHSRGPAMRLNAKCSFLPRAGRSASYPPIARDCGYFRQRRKIRVTIQGEWSIIEKYAYSF